MRDGRGNDRSRDLSVITAGLALYARPAAISGALAAVSRLTRATGRSQNFAFRSTLPSRTRRPAPSEARRISPRSHCVTGTMACDHAPIYVDVQIALTAGGGNHRRVPTACSPVACAEVAKLTDTSCGD